MGCKKNKKTKRKIRERGFYNTVANTSHLRDWESSTDRYSISSDKLSDISVYIGDVF